MWRSVPFSFFSRADWQWNQADTFPTCRWSLDLPLPIRERHVYKHSVQSFTPCAVSAPPPTSLHLFSLSDSYSYLFSRPNWSDRFYEQRYYLSPSATSCVLLLTASIVVRLWRAGSHTQTSGKKWKIEIKNGTSKSVDLPGPEWEIVETLDVATWRRPANRPTWRGSVTASPHLSDTAKKGSRTRKKRGFWIFLAIGMSIKSGADVTETRFT
jgi:hypothetical protein